MHFDDRLATVLRQPVTGETIARIQCRQLYDLLGTSPAGAQGPQMDAAYLRLAELSEKLSAAERAAMLGEPTLRLRSPRLLAELAEAEPAVALAAISAARLDEEQWLDVIPALPVRARGFVRHRRDLGPRVEALLERLGIGDRGLPPAAHGIARAEAPEPVAAPQPERIEGIGAIVRRIEEFRKARRLEEAAPPEGDAPRLPLAGMEEEARARRIEIFDFATDGEGRIVWADPSVAPMALGLALAARDGEGPVRAPPALGAAFRRRQPIRGALVGIAGAPAIAGQWQVDAAPRFERPGGQFTGYCGRMRRPAAAAQAETASARAAGETDRMRQILHELRTPVNAIQGFAEVIQQQLFGPTPHEYRALAASIAADSAHILAGFEELDRLVKLDAGALELEPGECDLAAIIAGTVTQLTAYTGPRKSGFALEQRGDSLPVAMAGGDAERLVWRLLATLAGAAVPGEVLKLRGRERGDMVRVTVRLPAALADLDDEKLFQAAAESRPRALSAGMFGVGFALRLAAAEARSAGGSLQRRDDRLRLSLPGLTRSAADHSQGDGALPA